MPLIHARSAANALALVLPFILLNFVVALRLEPMYSFLGSINVLTSTPWLPIALLLLYPIAIYVAIRPMTIRDESGSHRFYLFNIVWATLITVATVALWGGLGEDIIACDILKIPNCD